LLPIIKDGVSGDEYERGFIDGYNACVDELIGEIDNDNRK
jgi:hypothetical protein